MADVRERYEAYLEERGRELYLFGSGQKSTFELFELDDRFADVTSGDALDELAAERDAARLEDAREAKRRLHLAVLQVVVEARTRGLSAELSHREREQSLRVGADERGARAWRAALTDEADAARRAEIQAALERAFGELNPLREELLSERTSLLAGLGFSGGRAHAEAVRPGVDLDGWAAQAGKLLEATESTYRDLQRAAFAEAGCSAAGACLGDVERVAAMRRYDRFFPATGGLGALDFTTEGLGVRVGDVPGVEVDTEERPGKQPETFCVAPRLPGEIHLCLLPRGGVAGCESLFFHAGRALRFGFTSPALPVERRLFGDPALDRIWGLLLSARLADPDWIDEGPVAPRAEPFFSAIRYRQLAQMRTSAARLRFELALAGLEPGADPRGMGTLYAEEMSEALGCSVGAEGYLVDASLELAALDDLRARCVEARLSELLRAEYGRRFWKRRPAGDLLKELWNTGTTLTAETLSGELGLGELSVDGWIELALRA